MHNRINFFGISYANKTPLKRRRCVRPLKLNKNWNVIIERKKIYLKRSKFSYMGQCNDYFHIELRSFFSITNKNTLTRPANCKKTTGHHIHLSLCAKSRKTNDAKSRKWPKTSIWAIFWRFRGQISPNCKFFWKIGFIQIEGNI